jgi:superfamily II DNA or RNA helicase
MQTMLTEIDERNNFLIDIIIGLKNRGRKVFVFGLRIDHLKMLKEKVDEDIVHNNQEHMYSTKLYVGETKKQERKDAEKNGDILFASFKLTNKGLDIPRMDVVVYASPIKRDDLLEQSTGRMLRLEKFDDLVNVPLVIDIWDDISIYKKWGYMRNRYYKKENWYIENYKINDECITKEKVDEILDNINNDDFINNNLLKTCMDEKKEENIEMEKVESVKSNFMRNYGNRT